MSVPLGLSVIQALSVTQPEIQNQLKLRVKKSPCLQSGKVLIPCFIIVHIQYNIIVEIAYSLEQNKNKILLHIMIY